MHEQNIYIPPHLHHIVYIGLYPLCISELEHHLLVESVQGYPGLYAHQLA